MALAFPCTAPGKRPRRHNSIYEVFHPSPAGNGGFIVARRPLLTLMITLVLSVGLVAGLQPGGADERHAAEGWRGGGTDPDDCRRYYLKDVGVVCDAANGLYLVFDHDGRPIGYTHGGDPPHEAPPQTVKAPKAPDPLQVLKDIPAAARDLLMEVGVGDGRMGHCVDDPRPPNAGGDYHIKVLYARAYDDDVYQHTDDYVRMMAKLSNMHMDRNSMEHDVHNDLRFECAQGDIRVQRVETWTPLALTDFSTIQADLQREGFDDPGIKYWILWDDTEGCDCAGIAGMYMDENQVVTNMNNGGFAQYAVTFDADWTTFLHEGGHTMGAVQNGAPHSTMAGHCYDALDIMCYDDGGANGSMYPLEVCDEALWDCGQDDYYNVAPPPGDYLATNWNIGNSMNRFINFGESVLDYLNCMEDGIQGEPIVCVYQGGNEETTSVQYEIDWGDPLAPGLTTDGTYPPKVPGFWDHAYADPGTYTVKVRARDIGGVATAPSGWVPFTVNILPDPAQPIVGDCVDTLTTSTSFKDCPVQPGS